MALIGSNALINYSGVYWIDPDWGSHGNAFEAVCNFTLHETCIKPINPAKSLLSSEEVCHITLRIFTLFTL